MTLALLMHTLDGITRMTGAPISAEGCAILAEAMTQTYEGAFWCRAWIAPGHAH